MITILVWNHGIEFPEGCASLATNASIRYDYATLRRVKFFYYKGNQGHYLVCPNGHTLSLPPQPDTLFDIHKNDNVHGLTMRVIQYSLHNAVKLFSADITEEEEGRDDDGAEDDEQEPEP